MKKPIFKLFTGMAIFLAYLLPAHANAESERTTPFTQSQKMQMIVKGLDNPFDNGKSPLECSKLKNAPEYIKSKEGKDPVLRIAVLKRTDVISNKLLKKVLKIVEKQVNEDFAPYYGITAKFYTFENESEINWNKYVPLVIPDLLLNTINAIGFHDLQFPASGIGGNGFPIAFWIDNPPALPNGTPYLIIPMGTPLTAYGVIPASLLGDPNLPPTLETIFSNVVSHEVLETLGNYSVNKVFRLDNATGPTLNFIDFYRSEVCDPVEFTPGYIRDDFNVSNFVLPSWFVPGLTEGPFDFLNTTPAPFVPFKGEITVGRASGTAGSHFVFFDLISLPINPTTVFAGPASVIFALADGSGNIPKVSRSALMRELELASSNTNEPEQTNTATLTNEPVQVNEFVQPNEPVQDNELVQAIESIPTHEAA